MGEFLVRLLSILTLFLLTACGGGQPTEDDEAGIPTNSANIQFIESAYDFGEVNGGDTEYKTLVVSYSGTGNAAIREFTELEEPFSYRDGSYPGTGGTCGSTISSSCTIIIAFRPTEEVRSQASLNLRYFGGGILTNTSTLISGTGANTIPKDIEFTAESFDFGTVPLGDSSLLNVDITYNGPNNASIVNSSLPPDFEYFGGTYPGTGGTCADPITADCNLMIRFVPTASGSRSGDFEITYNAGGIEKSTTTTLDGVGAAPAVLIITDAPSYDYGEVLTGNSMNHTFSIANTGETAASSVSFTSLNLPFSVVSNTCGASIAPLSSCDIIVNFAPTSLGPFNDLIQIDYNDGQAAQVLTQNLTGMGTDPALLTISDGPIFDFGNVLVSSSQDQSFTITNTATGTAGSLAFSGLAAPYEFPGGFPGSGGDCGTSLAGGASCTIVIRFSPSSAANFTDQLLLDYNDGQAAQQVTRDISGTGVETAVLTISESPSYDFGTINVGANAEHSFTITNTGNGLASSMAFTGLSAPFEFPGGFPGTGGDCATSLAPAISCTIVVRFTPSIEGFVGDSIVLDYNDGQQAQQLSRNISGTGLGTAVLSISESPSYDYGDVLTTTSNEHTFIISNTGTGTANSIAISGLNLPFEFPGGYPGTGGNCSSDLAPSANCSLVIRFSPISEGPFSDQLILDYNDGQAAQQETRDINGNGVGPAVLTISDGPSYDYANVTAGASLDHSFTISNSGTGEATGLAFSGLLAPFEFPGGFPGTGGNCGTSLAGSSSCTVVIRFSPVSTANFTDQLVLDYNDGLSAQQTTRDLSGNGVDPAVLTISDGPTYDYGTHGIATSVNHSFSINNTGESEATAIAFSGLAAPYDFPGGFPGTGGDCGTSLAASSSCTIVIRFSPAAAATFNDQIILDYNDGAAAQQETRDITGEGIGIASLAISEDPSYDYGTVLVGSNAEHSFTITNSGTGEASSMAFTGLSAPFEFPGGFPGTGGDCSNTLNASSSCTIVVRYTPSIEGPTGDTIILDYNDGLSAQQITRNITGTGEGTAALTISDGPTYDFGNQLLGSYGEHSFSISNTGSGTATSIVMSGLAAPYEFPGGYPGTGGDCASDLAPSSSCSVVIRFTPTAETTYADQLILDYNDGQAAQQVTRDLTGDGRGTAYITISDGPTYDYGDVIVGSSANHTFTIENTGDGRAESISDSGISGDFSFPGGFPGTGGNCNATLAAGASCEITVRFSPSSPGAATDSILLDYDDGFNLQQATRALSANGLAAALLSLSDGPTYDFGDVLSSSTAEHTFTLSNTGDVDATGISGSGLGSPFLFAGGFPGTGGNCGPSLTAGSSCDIVVRFAPTLSGPFSDTILIDYNDGVSAQQTSGDVIGNGTGTAILSISDGPTYDYGSVSTSGTRVQIFTVSNSGSGTASSISGSGLAAPFIFPGGFPGIGGNCGSNLAASSSCNIAVRFAPSAATSYNDEILLDYFDGTSAQQSTRALTGTGATLASLSLSDGPTYDFGTLEISSIDEHHFLLSNTSSALASSLSGIALSAPFDFKGGTYPGTGGTCGSNLAASASCTIVVTASPASSGSFSDSLQIQYNDGSNNQIISVGLAVAASDIFAPDDTVTTPLDTAIGITLSASGSGPFTFSIVVDPDHGSISGSPPNIIYTPDTGFDGIDYFTYKANDGVEDSNIGTVRVFVEPELLFITKNKSSLIGADPAVYARLQTLGFNITIEDETDDQPEDAYGKDLIVVSSTILSANVGTTFRDSQIPFLTWESYLWDDMFMSSATSFGTTPNSTEIQIVNAEHPMASGLANGVHTFLTGNEGMRFVESNRLNSNAQIIQTQENDTSHVLTFGYESQVEMDGGILAPARRAGTFYQDDTFNLLNATGLQNFDDIIDWLMSGVISQFEDNFQRENSASLGSASYGNSWSETETTGTVSISNAKMLFSPADEVNLPLTSNRFSKQTNGFLNLHFYFDFTRSGSDNDYEVYIQLGEADLMNDNSPLEDGVAVNLKWAGTAGGMSAEETFGYVNNSSATSLAVASGEVKVEVQIDLDSNTYSLNVGGTTASAIPLENNVDIDRIRIFTRNMNGSDFSSSSIDNIRIFQGQ